MTLVVGIGLPYLFATLVPSGGTNAPSPGIFVDRTFVTLMVAVTVASLYVSSLATSGLRALMATVPLILVFGWFVDAAQRYVGNVVFGNVRGNRVPIVVDDLTFRATRYVPEMLVAVFLLMLLRFAFTNHRSADRSINQVAAQLIGVLAFATVFTVAMTAMMWLRPVTRFVR